MLLIFQVNAYGIFNQSFRRDSQLTVRYDSWFAILVLRFPVLRFGTRSPDSWSSESERDGGTSSGESVLLYSLFPYLPPVPPSFFPSRSLPSCSHLSYGGVTDFPGEEWVPAIPRCGHRDGTPYQILFSICGPYPHSLPIHCGRVS
jgi:hypothetical protein